MYLRIFILSESAVLIMYVYYRDSEIPSQKSDIRIHYSEIKYADYDI